MMVETPEPCSNSNARKTVVGEGEIEDSYSLWSIDDDTMFYAEGLKHHSAGKGKSVYVIWNESFVLNFVFKTSMKTRTTTLTKVRIAIPLHNQQQEKICNTLILEMNTLLYMESGNVYYFSSVKSMHKVDWLSGVRCISSCPLTQFSIIRLWHPLDYDAQGHKRKLSLEVYKDIPQLGKNIRNDALRHSYNITFDFDNLFNCDWLDEKFTLTSLVTEQENIMFLQQLVTIGDLYFTQQELGKLDINQEVHFFTISGTVFILVGGKVSEDELMPNPQEDNFSIHLLNTYACAIERICINCKNNLIIVLLQSGHMDIWYKSNRMFGSLLHCQYDVPSFLSYEFAPSNNTFFFTTPEEVLELKIITNNVNSVEKECIVNENRKCISGMTSCTFVEDLQQLICLSINNVFYKINFTTQSETIENCATNVENLNGLYPLNSKHIKELRAKADIVEELLEQPNYLHNAIEQEFKKQQILALDSKRELFEQLFQCYLEYHKHLPGIEYFNNDLVYLNASFQSQNSDNTQSIFCLIFMSLKSKKSNDVLSSLFADAVWYLYISCFEQYFQFHIPWPVLNNKLCVVVKIPLKDSERQILPKLSLDLNTFFNANNHTVCLKYKLLVLVNEKTYINLFSTNVRNVQVLRNSFNDIKVLTGDQAKVTSNSENLDKFDQVCFRFKQCHKIPKNILHDVMNKMKIKLEWLTGVDFKIYYLHQYLVELNYDAANKILTICSNYSSAIFYIKLLLMNAVQAHIEVGQKVDHSMQRNLINCSSMISDDPDRNLHAMHLENLRTVYLKLRLELYDTLR